jgi:hypothetical protein
MADDPDKKPIVNVRDLPPPKPLRRRDSPERDIKTAAEILAIRKAQAPSMAERAGRGLAILGVVVLLFVGIFFVLSAFDSDNSHVHAPWSNPSAPNVVPQPISQQ